MLRFDKQLYIVECKFWNTPHLCSYGEVQELIKRDWSNIIRIHKASMDYGDMVDFKHFVPKCYQIEYEPTQYYIQNLWLKIWNNKELD